jgi:hypothetical protein
MIPGKSVGVLVMTLLITLSPVLFLSTVQANKPITKYCVDGAPSVAIKKPTVKLY